MTAAQYRAACKSLGLSPAYGAAAALGISVASAQRYAKGTWPVPTTVVRLLDCMMLIDRMNKAPTVDWGFEALVDAINKSGRR